MRKLIIGIFCLFMLIACVSAADLESEDFGNFTISVPSDVSFTQMAPAGTSWTADSSGSLVPADGLRNYWGDEESDLSVEYAKGDYAAVMKDTYEGSKLESSDGNIHVYDISKCKYADVDKAVVVSENGETVIICGEDLDTLNELAKTVKFN